jgi:excisionase family DNA binding protein
MKTFDVEGAAEFLNVSTCTMKELAGAGTIPGAKIGKGWVFTDEDLGEYLRGEIRKQTAERRGQKPEPAPTVSRRAPPRRRPSPPPLLPSMSGYQP